MPSSEDKSYIEELKKSLYSRTAPDVRTRRKLRFSDKETEVRTDWNNPEDKKPEVVLNQHYEDHKMSFFTKLLIASFIFCLFAVGIGAYIFFNGSNLISANNIDIAISGPVSIPGGEVVSFDIVATNRNNVDLQLVDMVVNFPAGTTNPDDPSQSLTSYSKLIGDMNTGASVKDTVKAIIFGEENLQKEIVVSLTYGVKGSSAVFTKTQSYEVLINSSPINVTASAFKEITSGQEFDTKVSLKSNSRETLKGILLKASYPPGFTFLSSSLKPLSDNATWKIGDIPPGAERVVIIHGKLGGENSDAKVFHFNVGAQSSSNSGNIGTQYMAVGQEIKIQKPFVSVNVSVDGYDVSGDSVAQFNQSKRVKISWFNNLPTTISNMNIKVKLSGTAYDKLSVSPENGFYDSIEDTIIWNQKTNQELASVGAGDEGSVSFSVIPRNKGTESNKIIDPNLSFSVSVSGNRAQESNVPQTLSSAVTNTIKVQSAVSLSGRIVRSVGPFTNTGPVPPKAERATTYTVIWDVDNTSSQVGSAVVTATLPPYIKWLSAVNPAGEDIVYDQNSGQVTWNIGNIGTYTLNSSGRKEASFQVSLTPSVNHINQTPTSVNQATLTAVDSYTGTKLSSMQDYLTTRFSTDPTYKEGDAVVVK